MTLLREFFVPWLASNIAALALLAVARRKPVVARWLGALVFLWAAITNARAAIIEPQVYLEYARLTPSNLYRAFITGWFSLHIREMVLTIAAGQLAIAGLIVSPRPWRSLGMAGALVFLAAIAPLGVGSGFPFSVTFGLALVLSGRLETPAAPIPFPRGAPAR